MGSYLEAYGSQESQRAKRAHAIKIGSLIALGVVVVGLIAFFSFRNFREENEIKSFLQLLRTQQYQDAYRMWGCTEVHPCPGYSFPAFRDDWGAASPHANAAAANIGDVEACGNGVLVRVDYPGAEPVPLFVERGSKIIGFAPWKECPGPRWRFGAFFKSLVGK
jgi:hypothetical protein